MVTLAVDVPEGADPYDLYLLRLVLPPKDGWHSGARCAVTSVDPDQGPWVDEHENPGRAER